MERDGIDISVVLNTVTNVKQTENVNAFALSTMANHEKLIPFCSLHPLCENPKEALERLKTSGIKGIKLHPDYVGIEIDDERNAPLLTAASELNMPVIIHAGYDPVSPSKMHASPDAICRVLERYPDLTLIAAHLGGVLQWDEVIEKLCGKNLYLDTAFCCERVGITVEQGKKIFEKHPHDKIIFGSDAPWASPSEVLGFLSKLGLSDETKRLVLCENAKKLLNI